MSDLQLGAWAGALLSALWVTVYLTVLSAIAAFLVSLVLGLMARQQHVVPRTIARVIIEFFRGTSLLVQIFWLFFVLPQLGFRFQPLAVAVIALGLNFGAYGAEVVRGALNAVPKAQWEGAQALPLMIPPFNNLLIQLLKSTPLVFLIGLGDLTFIGDQYRDSLGNENFIFPLLLVIYFVLSYVLTLFMHLLEARAKARLGQREERRKILAFHGPMEEEMEPT